jgi:hypothetical protein
LPALRPHRRWPTTALRVLIAEGRLGAQEVRWQSAERRGWEQGYVRDRPARDLRRCSRIRGRSEPFKWGTLQPPIATPWTIGPPQLNIELSFRIFAPEAAMRSTLVLISCSAATSLALGIGDAAAEVQPVRLAWVRGEGADACPDELAITQSVKRRLGPDAIREDAPTRVEGWIERRAEWSVRLMIRDAGGNPLGQRELSSTDETCGAIAEAAILAIALTIDPTAPLTTTPEAPGPEAPPPDAEAADRNVPVELLPEPARIAVEQPYPPLVRPAALPPLMSAPVRDMARIGAHAVAAMGMLPGVAFGVDVAARIEVTERLWVGLGMGFLPEVELDTRFSFGLSWGTLSGCYDVLPFSRGGLTLCSHLHGGAVHGVVHELLPVDPGQQPWVAFGVAPELRLYLPWRLHAKLSAEGGLALLRTRFVLRDSGEEIFTQEVGHGLFRAGLGVALP